MTSYETSAIASSDSEEDYVEDSIGIICTTSTSASILPASMGGKIRWPFRVITAAAKVLSKPREYDPDSLDTLVSVATDLVDRGASVIVTDTGFSSMQRDLASRISVPVACSAMIQLSTLRVAIADGQVGVVTLDRQLISQWNLVAVQASSETPVIGLPTRSIWRQTPCVDGAPDEDGRIRRTMLDDLIIACNELIVRHGVRAIVLEDPRFAVFTLALQERLGNGPRGVKLYDIVSTVSWLYLGHRTLGHRHELDGQDAQQSRHPHRDTTVSLTDDHDCAYDNNDDKSAFCGCARSNAVDVRMQQPRGRDHDTKPLATDDGVLVARSRPRPRPPRAEDASIIADTMAPELL